MIGTLINVIAILVGSGIGMLFGPRLSDQIKSTVLSGMGIFTAAVGISSMLELKKIRVGNFLPALATAPVIVYVSSLMTK